jgi:thioredoxin reductase (NADPH)
MIYDLIVVGGGPGGIASVVEGSIFGLENILMLEKGDNHSQTIRKYYKDSKRVDKVYNKQEVILKGNVEFFDGTKETTLDYFEELLDSDGINSLYHTEVDSVTKEGDIFTVITNRGEYQGKKVIVSIGRMGKPNKPSYKIPASIRKNVNHNPFDCRGHEKILVVGGGDSGVEYACQLTVDNDVTLAVRGDKIDRANEINQEMVTRYYQEERLRIKFNSETTAIEPFENRIKVSYANGFSVIYDRVIYALGGTTPVGFLQKSNVEVDEGKHPIFDENYETSVKGLYIVGDIVYKKGGSIAMAINHAYDVMKHITSK